MTPEVGTVRKSREEVGVRKMVAVGVEAVVCQPLGEGCVFAFLHDFTEVSGVGEHDTLLILEVDGEAQNAGVVVVQREGE